jgi:hypothetical protein
MPEVKIDFRSLCEDLKKKVLEIENSDSDQGDKTRRFIQAGKSFRKQLYGDKRRYSGEKGEQKRISLNTYNTYLSRARRMFEDMGLRHHLLDRELERLKKRYPLHAHAIGTLDGLTPTETRLAQRGLFDQLRKAGNLRRQLSELDFSVPAAKKSVDGLRAKHPMYAEKLEQLLTGDAVTAMANLERSFREVDALIEDLTHLKVNHEIMYSLSMEKGLRETHTEKKELALGKKKRNAIAIHYPNYIQRVFNLLTNPTVNSSEGAMYGISPLTFALCAATGRRPIEILVQGQFRAIDEHRLGFIGQAKKRTESVDHERVIYSLVDSGIVLKALQILRNLPQVKSLHLSEGAENDTREKNAIISGRVSAPLNEFAKQFFADEGRVLKDTRAIYARICFELWFKVDPRWKKIDDDVFFAELLGHEDEQTQMHYKSFKVFDCDRSFEPSESDRLGRWERLAEYDNQMLELANGDAAVVLHEKIKQHLVENPDEKMTQSTISRITGAYRPLIQRYMELCADALGIEKQDNGRWLQLDEAKDPVLIEVDADELPAHSANDKPRFSAHPIGDGSEWESIVSVNGEEVARATGATRMAAQRAAWDVYQDSL